MSKMLKMIEQRLAAVAQAFGAHLKPIKITKIDADGVETILNPVDESKPHVKATIRYIRSPRSDDDHKIH